MTTLILMVGLTRCLRVCALGVSVLSLNVVIMMSLMSIGIVGVIKIWSENSRLLSRIVKPHFKTVGGEVFAESGAIEIGLCGMVDI